MLQGQQLQTSRQAAFGQRCPAIRPSPVSRLSRRVTCSAQQNDSSDGQPSTSSQSPCSTSDSLRQRFPLFTGLVGGSSKYLAVVLPGLGGIGGGRGGSGGHGGGGGGGPDWTNSANPLYYLAAADTDNKDSKSSVVDLLLSESTVTEEETVAANLDQKELVTSESDYEAAAQEAGGEKGERVGTRRCTEVVIEGWPEIGALPKKEELKDLLSVQEGFIFDYQDIVDDRRKLELQYDEYISNVDVRTEYVDEKTNHQRVVYKFRPHVFGGIDNIEIRGSSLMPQSTIDKIVNECLPEHPYKVDIGILDKLRTKIEGWYSDRGLPFCYVGFIEGMDEGVIRANVIEAKINDVSVRYEKHRPGGGGEDEEEYVTYQEGEVVPASKIIEASGFKKGDHYHIDDGQDAINSIYSCGLIDDINIEPEQDMSDPTKINIKVVVEEVQPKSMELDLDWALPLQNGLPKLSRQALIPGGSVEISHENLFGDSQSLSVSLSASDWRNPAQDLGFQMSYTEPFYKPHTTRNLQVFNTRKMSPVFTGSGTDGDVPPVFVDRFGAKGWTSYVGGQDDKVEHALILQQVTTCDQNGQQVTKGSKVSRGYFADAGPSTTLSDTGRDLSLSYQGFAALDDVEFVNGNQLGRRALVQLDQGLNPRIPLPGGRTIGLSGGIYNRLVASYTQFMQLPFTKALTHEDVWVKRRAPNSLVLHARAGNCIGDMASYDYFTLGGPYSVRGYSHGELGACRRFVEAAAEVRVPFKNLRIPTMGTVYAFTEMGSDLGSSVTLPGNPTEYYRKAGQGLSFGVGIKALGACRFEYARDCNAGTGTVFVQWGERF